MTLLARRFPFAIELRAQARVTLPRSPRVGALTQDSASTIALVFVAVLIPLVWVMAS